ncbi:MAG: uracil-DNA glycosylase [Patiriisocius sp.]|jgi:uracil-DNA glycosylase
MTAPIEASWKDALTDEFSKEYFQVLSSAVGKAYKSDTPIFPPQELIFNAFNRCAFTDVKVVILGQDPYHGKGQAHGLSFSVPDAIKAPPSLQNIFKEVHKADTSLIPQSGNLERWADQGVLLLNSTLTVEEGKPGSHQGLGWEQFTDTVITKISEEQEHVVFLLWGAFAQKKSLLIDESKHLVLPAPHPSPLSSYRGFFGCDHFNKINAYLENYNYTPVQW